MTKESPRAGRRLEIALGIAVFGVAAAVGCSSGSGGGSGGTGGGAGSTCTVDSATATTAISALDSRFDPPCAKVTIGQTITWTNDGATQHTVTSDAGAPTAFDSGTLNTGQTFSQTFSTAGTYDYHCTFHVAAGMVGTIIVQ